ncbi:uncharacterized protein C8Q71DRAFT_739588, partial [Rhodofomes roseus]
MDHFRCGGALCGVVEVKTCGLFIGICTAWASTCRSSSLHQGGHSSITSSSWHMIRPRLSTLQHEVRESALSHIQAISLLSLTITYNSCAPPGRSDLCVRSLAMSRRPRAPPAHLPTISLCADICRLCMSDTVMAALRWCCSLDPTLRMMAAVDVMQGSVNSNALLERAGTVVNIWWTVPVD